MINVGTCNELQVGIVSDEQSEVNEDAVSEDGLNDSGVELIAIPNTDKFVSAFDMQSISDIKLLNPKPPEYIVEGMLARKCMFILASPPKLGKSILALQLAYAVVTGSTFLGRNTRKGHVLYLNLEDDKAGSRVLDRAKRMGFDFNNDDLKGLYIQPTAERFGEGLEYQIQDAVEKDPQISLVIVDVYARAQHMNRRNASAYDRGYEDSKYVNILADSLNVAVLLIHHTRKSIDYNDPINSINGSNGFIGAADDLGMILRTPEDPRKYKVTLGGREIEGDFEFYIEWKTESLGWKLCEERFIPENVEYTGSPIVRTIKRLVSEGNGKWSGTASDLVKAGRDFGSEYWISEDARLCGRKARDFASRLDAFDGIVFMSTRTQTDRSMKFVKRASGIFEGDTVEQDCVGDLPLPD